MDRIRAVVVAVFLAHVALHALFYAVAASVDPATFVAVEAARSACASHPGGPARLLENTGTIVAGRWARAPFARFLLGPWPELIAPFAEARCARPAPHPLTFLPTRAGSYALMGLSLLAGTAFWSVTGLATVALLERSRSRRLVPA
jgi:hypothetical protein